MTDVACAYTQHPSSVVDPVRVPIEHSIDSVNPYVVSPGVAELSQGEGSIDLVHARTARTRDPDQIGSILFFPRVLHVTSNVVGVGRVAIPDEVTFKRGRQE